MKKEQEHATELYELINAAWMTRALAVAAELRIAEALCEPQDADALAHRLDCDADKLRRLLTDFLCRWPDTEGTVLDLAHARAGAERQFELQGVGRRASFVIASLQPLALDSSLIECCPA